MYHNIVGTFGRYLRIVCEFSKYTFWRFCNPKDVAILKARKIFREIPVHSVFGFDIRTTLKKFDLFLTSYRNVLGKFVIMYILYSSLGISLQDIFSSCIDSSLLTIWKVFTIFAEYLLISRWQIIIDDDEKSSCPRFENSLSN